MRVRARLARLRDTLFRRDELDRDLDAELRAAVDTLAERHRRNGMDPQAARRAATAAIGNLEQVKYDVRRARIGASLETLFLDLRHIGRSLRNARAFTAVVVATLALGIGANAALFSIVRAMLIEALPYRDADRLVFIWRDRTAAGYPRGPMSGPDFGEIREGAPGLESLGGIWASGTVALTGDGPAEQLRSALVTTNFFDVLGSRAALGRTFTAADGREGAEPTIMIGWELFQRRFNGDRALIGQRVNVNGAQTTVIGVMPEGFRLLLPADASVPDRLQAFVPFGDGLEQGSRGSQFLRVIGRMRPGVTVEQAREQVTSVAAQTSRLLGRPLAFTTVGLQAEDVREIRLPLLALSAG